jgi:uncharacterized protein (TIGR03435 family)
MFQLKAAIPVIVIAIAILDAGSARAQPAARPQFEVASVKRNNSGERGMDLDATPGGRLTAKNAPLRLLIKNAYDVRDFQILGAPGWVESERWDIEAKAGDNAGPDQLVAMLQTLLEARFKLTFHRETKEFPVYTLAAAKNGLKLPNAKEGICAAPDAPTQSDAAGQPARKPCGRVGVMLSAKGGKLKGENVTTAALAKVLGNIMDRPIAEKTGFKGTFDIDVGFTPDQLLAGLPNLPPGDSANAAASSDAAGTSIFAALQQLGLKLESTKGPVEVLIIDHVEKPGEN